MAVLYAFAGLPGVGKTTLAIALAQRTGATYLRIDALDQGLRDTCGLHIHAEGYELAAYMATDCLKQGLSVICDSCNTIAASRVSGSGSGVPALVGAGYSYWYDWEAFAGMP